MAALLSFLPAALLGAAVALAGDAGAPFAALRKQALDAEAAPPGKAFLADFANQGFGQLMANAVRTCIPDGTAAPKPFVILLELDQTGSVADVLFDHGGRAQACLKPLLLGYKGAKPPRSPYYLDFDMAFK